jgi:hypothetical protein
MYNGAVLDSSSKRRTDGFGGDLLALGVGVVAGVDALTLRPFRL